MNLNWLSFCCAALFLAFNLYLSEAKVLPPQLVAAPPERRVPEESIVYGEEYESPEVRAYQNRMAEILKELKMEAAIEAAQSREEAALRNAPIEESEPIEMADENPDVHMVDKRRRRRYGFWVSAMNKMDNHHLRGFLGQHRNVYNVYKRAAQF